MKIREYFSILNTKVHDHPLVYLDNAATMQMPDPVLNRIQAFYHGENANIHRGIHSLSEKATAAYEAVRETVREFLDAEAAEEIIFTSGTTASINLAAQMLERWLIDHRSEMDQMCDAPGMHMERCPRKECSDDFGLPSHPGEILVTGMEHHSDLLPWMELANRRGLVLKVIPVQMDGTLDLAAMESMLSDRVQVVAFTEVSNVTGIRNPVREIIETIRSHCGNAWILVDGAQGVVHGRQSIRSLGADFYCFSGHKLGAPTGTGVLYVRAERRKQLKPVWYGGGIVHRVSYDHVSYVKGPSLFEPGTPNYAGVIGLGAALEFWMEMESADGMHAGDVESSKKEAGLSAGCGLSARSGITKESSLPVGSGLPAESGLAVGDEELPAGLFWSDYEGKLLSYLERTLQQIDGVRILGEGQRHFGCLSFVAEQMHAYDICRMLDQYGIAVRSGHMCAQPYLKALGCEHAVRISVAPYNTMEEMEYFARCLREVLTVTSYQREMGESLSFSMKELEQDILQDLAELADPMDQYSFLVACSGECLPYPAEMRTDAHLIPQCQVNTWVYTHILDGKCVFFADSESLIVKGVLALLQEIFSGRTEEELSEYSCGLLISPLISQHLNRDQLAGLQAILEAVCGKREMADFGGAIPIL